MLRLHGSRIVDPGEPGGGKLRPVTILYGSPTDHVWRAIRGAVEFYAAGSILLLLVTGPLIAWLLHRGLLPLRQLAALAAQVSVDSWQFSPPASARRPRELAPLTQAIRERAAAPRTLLRPAKRTFVSDAAHELKTAVAVVKSSLQLLAMKQRTPAEYQAGLDRCLADTLRLEDTVAKMLTLARWRLVHPQPDRRPVTDLAFSLPSRRCRSSKPSPAFIESTSSSPFTSNAVRRSTRACEDCSLLLSNLLLNALAAQPRRVERRTPHLQGI